MHRIALAATLVLLFAASAFAWSFHRRGEAPLPREGAAPVIAEERTASEPIRPLAPHAALDAAKVALGGRLFHDPSLSRDGTVSCATCHDLRHGGADGRPRARGLEGAVGPFNTPTVYNAWINPVQFWDGRADSLEAQVEGPLTSPLEMGSSWAAVMRALRADGDYVRRFAASYAEGVAPGSVTDAIAEFERSLTSLGSRFDRFLRGEAEALSTEEAEGYRAFKSYGCASCHQGVNVGGNLFETFGVFGDYFADRGGEEQPEDLGRYNVTGRDEDRHRFRVPSLRLAALTAPYFHDGSVATLEEAVRLMARYQVGRDLGPRDERRIVQFLRTLPGDGVQR